MNGRADALSRRADVIEEETQKSRPILKLAALETCEPVWTDDQILEHVRKLTKEDSTLQPILSYFQNGAHKAPIDIR